MSGSGGQFRPQMYVSVDRTPLFLRPGRFAVDEEWADVERPQPPGKDERDLDPRRKDRHHGTALA